MPNSKFSEAFKHEVLLAYEKRECTIKAFCSKFQITKDSLREWLKQFEKYGSDGLQQSTTWKPYSKALKEAAVKDFLSGDYSAYEIVSKYDISSRTVLQGWVNAYNSYRGLKDTSKERTSSMTKGRKTTWDERIQIVLDCLGDRKDY
ncbi:Transposase and inactivated derivatives [Evansella caseinilytica]|uniref:Transposase and inactivated derivatives n=1 Tax=Evansella caseinilytica TaxID=1503961 RepID=A0A1H3V3K2_9BACI|nr:Transposase and inactivated derivatives [Evansella caseinilytica]